MGRALWREAPAAVINARAWELIDEAHRGVKVSDKVVGGFGVVDDKREGVTVVVEGGKSSASLFLSFFTAVFAFVEAEGGREEESLFSSSSSELRAAFGLVVIGERIKLSLFSRLFFVLLNSPIPRLADAVDLGVVVVVDAIVVIFVCSEVGVSVSGGRDTDDFNSAICSFNSSISWSLQANSFS